MPSDLPDIFYLIPDRYPRADTLVEAFNYDNSTWLTGLEQRGFQVADRSLANYPSTALSLASTWNLAPVSELVDELPDNKDSWKPIQPFLRDHALGRMMIEAGYEYVHMGSFWWPTSIADAASENLRIGANGEIADAYLDRLDPSGAWTTDQRGIAVEDLPWQQRSPLTTLFQLRELKRLAAEQYENRDRPRFILAHIAVPHEPYAFEADGSGVPPNVAATRTFNDSFLRQLGFINSELVAILDIALSGPREDWPMVVIQSDEGPHAERQGRAWDWADDATLTEQRTKLRTLSAILMPAGSDLAVPEDLTGVNTWRLLLDEILGTDFGLLPDQVFVYSPDSRYQHIDVTNAIRG